VHQRQLSVPYLWGQLMCTSESLGVNGHTTRCTSSVSGSCGFGWCPIEGQGIGDQRRPMGHWGWGKDFTYHRADWLTNWLIEQFSKV